MKKIDLHIHTKKSVSDHDFDFSIENLKAYIKVRKIDCIAITNHNLFDMEQFNYIKSSLDIVVYPGVEVDLEKGHLLVIAPLENISDFSSECKRLEERIISENDYISYEEFRSIFSNTDNYLLIPHYKKRPVLNDDIIRLFNGEITAGEVKNHRDFGMIVKDKEKLVPVLFSDIRVASDIKDFSFRQTYINTEELELNDIKHCLKDRNKVCLNKEGKHELFQILEDGFVASNGLNVILGERSSGKTVTLNKIKNTFENVKYIPQFSLIEKDEEKETAVFKEKIKINKQCLAEKYLKEFKSVVDDVVNIDSVEDGKCIDNYLSSLLKYAQESDRLDSYSKTKIFTEDNFEINNLDSLKKLISAVNLILDNKEYEFIINKHINRNSLKLLLKDLILEYRLRYKDNLYKKQVNSSLQSMQANLSMKTSITQPLSCDLKEIYKNSKKIEKFNILVNQLKIEKDIANEELYDFTIQAISRPMTTASDIKKTYGKQASFTHPYKHYKNGFDYLKALKEMSTIPDTELYKLFIKIDYKILNQYNLEVSGGERSEFNLLNELSKASNYDMLLIDEPESSFDNIFLNDSVNSMLKKISQNMPVFVVTHNNTIGESIRPDYIIYTKRNIVNREAKFEIYGGYPTSKYLQSVTGDKIKNFNAIMGSLEGGLDVYEERKRDYEILRDKK